MDLSHENRKRYPSPAEIEKIYAERDADIQAMRERGAVVLGDLKTVDRLGRFRIATELWDICSNEARARLRLDEHHSVRSAAAAK